MRVVVDTNVLVSAVLFRSSQPAIALRQILQGETLLISQAIFEEILHSCKVFQQLPMNKPIPPADLLK